MKFLLTFVIFNLLPIFINCSTTCEDSSKNFARLCFAPKPLNFTDFSWLTTRVATNGLYSSLGNDIMRLRQAQALKGELLSLRDDFDDLCLTAANDVVDTSGISTGSYFGFGNRSINWTCKFSADYPLLFLCEYSNPEDKKSRAIFYGSFNGYVSYTDHSNFIVEVFCYPNGEVGWLATATSKGLTDENKKSIIDHITSLGFSDDNTVTLYEEKYCTPEIK